MWLPPRPACSVFFLLLAAGFCRARPAWSELNITCFTIDTSGDRAIARERLATLEQLRWTIGKWLENPDLRTAWPVRVLLTDEPDTRPDLLLRHGQYLLAVSPRQELPWPAIAHLLLQANTGPLPAEIESAMGSLFERFEAKGSIVTLGVPPPRIDLNWARMQLLATRPEYAGRLPVFFANLRNGSDLATAVRNAFGKDPAAVEQETALRLAQGGGPPVRVSSRALDPKRDFGEHSLDPVVAAVYLADCRRSSGEQAYREALEAGGPAAALALESRWARNGQPDDLRAAMDNGSASAQVYLAAASQPDLAAGDPATLLERAHRLNPAWAEPVYQQAQRAGNDEQKETLLVKAAELAPRSSPYWEELARLQDQLHHSVAAQASWLRAERAAPTEVERERIRRERSFGEDRRLSAEERDRRHREEAARAEEERVRNAAAERVHQAEQRANRDLAANAGSETPRNVVGWEEFTKQSLRARVVEIACDHRPAILIARDRAGKTSKLAVPDLKVLGSYACGSQPANSARATLQYTPRTDEALGTIGDLLSISRE